MTPDNCNSPSTNAAGSEFPGRIVNFADVRFPTKPHIANHKLKDDPAPKLNKVDGTERGGNVGGLLRTDQRPRVNVHAPDSPESKYKDEV